jgi:hypothetical protein
MRRACADFRLCPARGEAVLGFFVVLFAFIAQRGGGDEHARRGREHGFGQRLGRVDPMPVHADIYIIAALPFDGEPVRKARRFRVGIACRLVDIEADQRLEHMPPTGNGRARAPVEAANGGIETDTCRGLKAGGFFIERAAQNIGKCPHRPFKPC